MILDIRPLYIVDGWVGAATILLTRHEVKTSAIVGEIRHKTLIHSRWVGEGTILLDEA